VPGSRVPRGREDRRLGRNPFVAGLGALVLGIITAARNEPPTLVALLIVGVIDIIRGSALSGLVPSFMRPESRTGAAVAR
jgi:hypothetical protein